MEMSRDLVPAIAVEQYVCEYAGQVSSSSATSTWWKKKNKKKFFQVKKMMTFDRDFRLKKLFSS